MSLSDSTIETFALLEHDSLAPVAMIHEKSTVLFKDSVIRPSLKTLAEELEQVRNSDNEALVFYASDLEDLSKKTVEAYLLTVQAMWERGLRKILVARERKLCGGAEVKSVEAAKWGGQSKDLQSHFQRLMGIPLQCFDSYADLDLLQNLANAIRHGDGKSAKRVYDLCPGLWLHWLSLGGTPLPGQYRVNEPSGAPTYPSFETITLPEALLEQMIQSVLWFWEDIETIRCNSFRNRHPSVESHLAALANARQHRTPNRIWTFQNPLGLLNRGK